LIAVLFGTLALASFVYLAREPGSQQVRTTLVSIPEGSEKAPLAFNITTLLEGTYRFPVNLTVVLGVNNTVQWRNDDGISHTVSSFIVPKGAPAFNSNLIAPGGTFSVSLTVPGLYRYTCIWHPWVAGQITVKAG
jgi:hypothetical protein